MQQRLHFWRLLPLIFMLGCEQKSSTTEALYEVGTELNFGVRDGQLVKAYGFLEQDEAYIYLSNNSLLAKKTHIPEFNHLRIRVWFPAEFINRECFGRLVLISGVKHFYYGGVPAIDDVFSITQIEGAIVDCSGNREVSNHFDSVIGGPN